MIPAKPLFPGGIRTRVFCSWGGCDVLTQIIYTYSGIYVQEVIQQSFVSFFCENLAWRRGLVVSSPVIVF
jgi:hypothetical protein